MRRTILAAAILFPLAFMCGVAFQKLCLRARTLYVSPCTLTEHRTIYQTLRGSDLVNVRGLLYGGEYLYLADKDLAGCGDSLIGIELPADGKIAFESQDLIRELRRLSNKERMARAEFEVIGTLVENERHCFVPRYVIKVQQILPVGPLELIDSSALANEITGAR